jgi:hypothetical protein
MPAVKQPGLDGLGRPWAPGIQLVEVEPTRRTDHGRYGTIERYRVLTDDGIEREVIHGRSTTRRDRGPVHLTVGTAAPLSLGPEGPVMHSLLKAMERGLDGIVFGPERSPDHVTDHAEVERLASTMSFPMCAHVSHLVCDHLAETTSTDLSNMLWMGVSLGAMKGLTFAAFAPVRRRRVVYAQFVVPVCPFPQAPPTEEELKRFTRGERGAMVRLSAGLLAHDMRSRMFQLNQNVARALRPGLTMRYLRAMPRDSVSNLFTEGWRDAVVSGDAGVAASRLPAGELATFELYDRDEGYTTADWRRRLGDVVGDRVLIVEKRGRHTDALALPNQNERERNIGRVVRAIRQGVPIEEIEHPYRRD